ncbi:cation diffusion facilitator family transporter [Shimia abyssi]|uniref:Cation diffusion facilitator family transporter n=1 Tax=Shimia abyssi TaxID=1662395 RepID=A0A2P8EYK4_9RHOB|nr:cation transporter [Shimia abyssi]PSL14543.1 cation diffusion facilitator family transporter [Shimia abyssi]
MSQSVQYRVTGMDCASCAAKIEKAVRSAGVNSPRISTASQILTLDVVPSDERLAAVELAVSDVGYHLDRLRPESSESSEKSDEVKPHLTARYRRALWIVIFLNVGYGAIEMIGGFLAGSQALKADALDFVGDGLITLLGVLAIGWSLLWRARSALIQGLFLGALGFGVLGNTIWRVFAQQPVVAELMGMLALVALAVNVGAALVLIPHRAGDANVRAVWLFSRNDAIGNAAVVVAAVLVALTGTSWPDLIVAFAIAALFLQSSWVIVRDARRDISEVRS